MVPDVTAWFLTAQEVRTIEVNCLFVGAILTFIFAFTLTVGASWRCPLGAIRWLQKYALGVLSITMGYFASYIWANGEGAAAGPACLMLMAWMTVLIISAVRHLLAPAIPESNNWRDFRQHMSRVLSR